jgi:hypothetical protein
MTPIPLLLLLWGIAMALQLLPHRIWGIALPKTPAWYRAGRVLGIAATLSSSVWLLLDLTLPRIMQRQGAGKLADTIGWGCVLVAAFFAVVLIRSAHPASEADSPH